MRWDDLERHVVWFSRLLDALRPCPTNPGPEASGRDCEEMAMTPSYTTKLTAKVIHVEKV
jgi:hypothetical protein